MKRMRTYFGDLSLWLLSLPACAFQPPVSSHIVCVPQDSSDWYVRQFAGHLSRPYATKVPSLWSKDDWFVRQFLQTASLFLFFCRASSETVEQTFFFLLGGGVLLPFTIWMVWMLCFLCIFFTFHIFITSLFIILILIISVSESQISCWLKELACGVTGVSQLEVLVLQLLKGNISKDINTHGGFLHFCVYLCVRGIMFFLYVRIQHILAETFLRLCNLMSIRKSSTEWVLSDHPRIAGISVCWVSTKRPPDLSITF